MWDSAVTDRFIWRVVRSGSRHAVRDDPTEFVHILKYQFKLITRTHLCTVEMKMETLEWKRWAVRHTAHQAIDVCVRK